MKLIQGLIEHTESCTIHTYIQQFNRTYGIMYDTYICTENSFNKHLSSLLKVYSSLPYKGVSTGVIRWQMVCKNILEFDAPRHSQAPAISSSTQQLKYSFKILNDDFFMSETQQFIILTC